MNIHDILQASLNGVAETQHYFKPQLEAALEKQLIYPAGKAILGNYDTYYEYFVESQSEKFFDMTTFIRLGSAVEGNFKRYYMYKVGHANLLELQNDRKYSRGIFQRIQDGQQSGMIALYKDVLGIELTTIPGLKKVQELMMHRHLYAHNSGLLDDDYLRKIKTITGVDLLAQYQQLNTSYPLEDVYWFNPLERLPEFIEDARNFFSQLP